MNNILFSLTRYLRDSGYDAHLFLLGNEPDHFMPEADTYTDAYKEYVHQRNWGDPDRFLKIRPREITQTLTPYERLIGSDIAPAYVWRAHRFLHIFYPHGSDMYGLPAWKERWYDHLSILRPDITYAALRRTGVYVHQRLARAQRDGILAAQVVNCDTELFQEAVPYLHPKQLQFFGLPFVYLPEYSPEILKRAAEITAFGKEFQRIRSQYDFMVFHHSRQLWKNPPSYHYDKGNDKLIRGFAEFVMRNPDATAVLILFEYGPDIQASKELIGALGIEEYVRWMPKMVRKEIMVGLSMADVGTGQFAAGFRQAGVIQEVLAMGKPLLHYRDDLVFDSEGGTPAYPMWNARTVEDIADALTDMYRDPQKRARLGEKGRQWYVKYTQRSIAQHCAVLEAS